MSINTAFSTVSNTTQVANTSSSENTQKTGNSSFKDELTKVTEDKSKDKVESKTEEPKVDKKDAVSESEKDIAKVSDEKAVDKADKNEAKPNAELKVEDEKTIVESDKNNLIKDNQVQLNDKNNLLDEMSMVNKFNPLQDKTGLLDSNNLAEQQVQNIIVKDEQIKLEHINKNKTNLVEEELKDEILDPQILAQDQILSAQIAEQNNFNADTHKVEENDMLSGNVIFNNAISMFDVNNIELANNIQQMVNTSRVSNVSEVKPSTGLMSLNSKHQVSMTQSDAEFFVNLTQTNDVSMHNIVAQAHEMVNNGAEVKEVKQNIQVSQALLDALQESRESNQPLRIDFDKDISVIIRVGRDGALAANFIPGDKAVEQYLRNNIESLKNSFDENNLSYSDLSYSSRGSKQQKENQRDKQQNQK